MTFQSHKMKMITSMLEDLSKVWFTFLHMHIEKYLAFHLPTTS